MNDFAAGWLGCHRVALDECGSTNDEAARLARAGARHGTIVTARTQRAGRGREGRAWASPPGLGLYVSAIVRPPLPLSLVPPMTLAIGVGVCDAARELGAPATLKWPNDTLVGRRKLAGVLVEAQSQGARLESIVVGIGLDLGGELPAEVAEVATTVERVTGIAPSHEHALTVVLGHVERWIDRYVACGLAMVIPAWHERMARGLVARSGAIVGEIVGIDDDGAVILVDGLAVQHRVRSGDVETIGWRDAADAGLVHEPESATATC